MGLVFSLCGV